MNPDMTILTDKELDVIEERVNKATEGPWEYSCYQQIHPGGQHTGASIRRRYISANDNQYVVAAEVDNGWNGRFIARARQDVLDLIKLVRAQAELLKG